MTTTDFDFSAVQDLGGWVAFLIVIVLGGRSFMDLARSFSAGVLKALTEIKDAIASHDRRLDELTSKLERQTDAIERLEQRHNP